MGSIEIIFTGIVYLLGTSSTTSGSLDVIIPNVSMAASPAGHPISEHTAYLKIEKSHIVNFMESLAIRPPNFVYKTGGDLQGPTPREYAVYVLQGQDISITATNMSPNPLTICRQACGTNRQSYDYVAHRELICPTCGKLDPIFKMQTHELVAARVLNIGQGVLSAREPVGGDTWIFEPTIMKYQNQGYKHQKVAQRVALDIHATEAFKVTITPWAHPPDPPAPALSLTLTQTATIEIGNMPLADVLYLPAHGIEAVDQHFGFFYSMLAQPVPRDPPVPHREMFPVLPPTGGPRQNCPPLADEMP